jgi:hypothetical protein
MERLLGLAREGSADPHVFAGLAYVLRFAGLCEESLAADERARRLDPGVRTSAHYTLYFLRRFEHAVDRERDDPPVIRWLSLLALGRGADAAREMRAGLDRGMEGLERDHVVAILAVAEGRLDDARRELGAVATSAFRDPEGLFVYGALAARAGDPGLAARILERAVAGGFFCLPAFRSEPALDALPGFDALVRLAERRHAPAREAFDRLGGARLLGL